MSKTKNKSRKSGSKAKTTSKTTKVHLKGKGPKTQAPHTPVNGLKISRPALKDVKFKSPPKRGTIYQPVLDLMAKYKPGDKPIQVEIPTDISARVLHNRLNATIRRVGPKAPKGYFWQKRTGDDGGKEVVLILLEKDAKDEPKAA